MGPLSQGECQPSVILLEWMGHQRSHTIRSQRNRT
jgi:hypothetical protein